MCEEETSLGSCCDNKRKRTSSSSDNDDDFFPLEEGTKNDCELDCHKWDKDCQILTLIPEKVITGRYLKPTRCHNPHEIDNKQIKLMPAEIRSDLVSGDTKRLLQTSWVNSNEFVNNGVEIITTPFKVCIVNNFLHNASFLNGLREEFNDIVWTLRNMDLYEFFQSADLKHLHDKRCISSFYEFLQNNVMTWVAELTGLQLTHVSATCSLYSNTDYLLVHDDQRGDRVVAFILYLTGKDGWDKSKGGALELLNKDDDGQPLDVVREILPANNQFLFFPVTNDSYHQVAEVTTLSDCRLSINGWFHTKVAPVFITPVYKPHPEGLYSEKKYQAVGFDGDLSAWLTPEYLKCDLINEIQEYFEENSEISLKNFLRKEPLNEILEVLNSDLSWSKIGPPNRHCYDILNTNNLPQVLERFLLLLQSKPMFLLLRRYTGLELDQESAYMKFEFQKWQPGSYSMLNDYDWNERKELDLIITFGCKDNSDVIGARTLYVSAEEEVQDALITVEPDENSLNLVYRDTARFTKYFSTLSKCRCFYMLMCSYTE